MSGEGISLPRDPVAFASKLSDVSAVARRVGVGRFRVVGPPFRQYSQVAHEKVVSRVLRALSVPPQYPSADFYRMWRCVLPNASPLEHPPRVFGITRKNLFQFAAREPWLNFVQV